MKNSINKIFRKTNHEEPLFIYKSTTIYPSDLESLSDGQWLQDPIIGFYYDYLEQKLDLQSSQIFLFQPSMAHLIAHAVDVESAREALPPEISQKEYAFLPTNNGNIHNTSGSHWSLLVYQKSKNLFRYYDSCYKTNLEATKIVVERMCILFNQPKASLIIETPTQQTNDYDCGIYTLLYTEALVERILKLKLLKTRVQQALTSSRSNNTNDIFRLNSRNISFNSEQSIQLQSNYIESHENLLEYCEYDIENNNSLNREIENAFDSRSNEESYDIDILVATYNSHKETMWDLTFYESISPLFKRREILELAKDKFIL
ncbi:hypothetical protein BB558_000289 [Smittium angustum]|uniref:Ubiquitin-like protease family profile domain-containing protein n=1 Tax=Smittium angustum TaxID=133377 RepID=A0A2U1JEV2_SMIAN|nr:hypothetical protein BB558_000289 [Smittium angustum]